MPQQSYLLQAFKWLFLMVIFLIPFFGSFPYSLPAFASFTASASAYPATLLVVVCSLFIFSTRMVWNRLDLWFHGFLLWTLISYLLADLANQTIATTDYFVLAVVFSLYNSSKFLFSRRILEPADLKKTLLLSSVPLLGYISIELGAYALGLSPFEQLLSFVEPIIHSFSQGVDELNFLVVHSRRVRGLAMEPSFYSCIFTLFFAFFLSLRRSRAIQSRWQTAGLAILASSVFYAGSNSVWSVFLLILTVYGLLHLRKKYGRMTYTLASFVAAVVVVVAGEIYYAEIVSYFTLTDTSYSHSTRFYSAFAQVVAAMDSPIFGFGSEFTKADLLSRLPPEAFHVAVAEYWYLHNLQADATFFSLAVRVLTQSGMVGVVLFIGMWVSALRKCYNYTLQTRGPQHRDINSYPLFLFLAIGGSFTLTLFVGVLIVYPYWILLGLASALHHDDSWTRHVR